MPRGLPRSWVPRPRLDQLLDAATARPLTLVVAPAGSGKTAMLRAWAAQQPRRRVRWFDPTLAAESGARTAVAEVVADAVAAGRPAVVVVDDAHVVPSRDLRAALDHLVAGKGTVRLVLAARRDLSLPLVRLELADEVTTIRAAHLRFTDDEAVRLITAHAGPVRGLDAESLQIVQHRSGGWAAALVLGARAVGSATDPTAVRQALASTEQPVLDYLLGEVFDTLDARTRHVLLCTCSADVVTSHDAALMSADPDAGALVARLATEGLLVSAVPTDDDEASWSYHPLMRELLRRRVRPGEAEHVLHAAAQERIMEHSLLEGDVASAVRHAAHLSDQRVVCRLLAEHGLVLIGTGDGELVTRSLDAVPDDVQAAFPELVALRALERRIAGDVKAATRLAHDALNGPEAHPPTRVRRRVPPSAAAISARVDVELALRCWLARAGLLPATEAAELARDRLGCTDQDGRHLHVSMPPLSSIAAEHGRAWLLVELAALECWLGDLPSARSHADAGLVMQRALGSEHGTRVAQALSAVVDVADGAYPAADRLAVEVTTRGPGTPLEVSVVAATAHVVHAWVALNELDAATTTAQLQGVRAGLKDELDVVVEVMIHLLECELMAYAGQVTEARDFLDAPPAMPGPPPLFVRRWYAVRRAWCAVLVSDARSARVGSRELRACGLPGEAAVVDAITLDLDGDPAGAANVLEGLALGVDADGPDAGLAALYLTWLLVRQGQPEAARTPARHVIDRLGPYRHLAACAVAGRPALVRLLAQEVEAVHGHPASAAALARLAALTIPRQPTGPGRDRPLIIDLTARETDVLRELALGGSYTDIASTLYITENTVKTHLASLYRKLGANRRADALRVARHAGLIRS